MSEDRQRTRIKREHPHGDHGSGFSAGLKRVFGHGENPLEWSVPFGRVAGITMRLHLVFPIYILSRLIWSISRKEIGFAFMLPLMVSSFVLVLAHELGHCYACRRVGGRVEKVIMWPLGGLAETFPPAHWRASLVSALGGPCVNLALWPIFAGWVYIATNNLNAVFFFPLESLSTILLDVRTPQDQLPTWLMVIWSLHFVNTLLLIFNLFLPMMPMDAGRVLQSVLWRNLGWKHSMEIAAVVGIVCGGALGVFAVAGNSSVLLIVAGLGIWVCYQEHRRLKFLEQGGEDRPIGTVVLSDASDEPRGEVLSDSIKREIASDQSDQGEVDRILAKISEVGMDGLSGAEKRTLKQVTKRNRDTE